MMKKTVILLLLCSMCLSLSAETGTIVLINRRSYWFHYCIDPQGMQGEIKNISEYLDSGDVTFYSIGPEATKTIESVQEGTHYLLGFWRITEKEQIPVLSKRFIIHANEIVEFDLANETYQVVVKEPEEKEVTVPAVPGQIIIDNNYDDWKVIPPAAVFSEGYLPIFFKKQGLGSINYVPIKHSLFWGKGGTPINQVKLYVADDYLYIYFSSFSHMTTGLSYYLYLFKSRNKKEQNKYTIELIIDEMADTSRVILWQKERDKYEVIGELKNTSFCLEARVELSKLPLPIKDIISSCSFDLTSSYFDSKLKLYEEFFFTTIYGKDIITKDDLNLK
jgi:hypothetical protein